MISLIHSKTKRSTTQPNKTIKTMKSVNPKNHTNVFYMKDDSYNFLINMRIEKFLSPNNKIIKILKNNKYTIIISEVICYELETIFTKTLEILVCTNKIQDNNNIRFEFCKKFQINIRDKFQVINQLSNCHINFNFFLICDKFILIDCPIQVIVCDFIKQLYSILIEKKDKIFNLIFTFDEYIKSPKSGIISMRNYTFCFNEKKELYYFILDDNFFELDDKFQKRITKLRKIKINGSDQIHDLKVNIYKI